MTSSHQDKGKYRTNTKDQFYTNEDIAKECIQSIFDKIPNAGKYLWIEPAAGSGSFYNNLPNNYRKIGIDIEPKSTGIIEANFMTWAPPNDKNIIIFGNPPFGRQSSLAKSFIKKSCDFANIIAFILPKSFTKPSMYNAFNMYFHNIHSEELKKNSFILNGQKYDVPCVFQIWQQKNYKREKPKSISPKGYTYVNKNSDYHFAFRRVGALAGKCYHNNGSNYSEQSHHFIKLDDYSTIHTVMEKINSHIFPSNTVGARSLSKTEINTVINTIINAL